MPGRTVHEFMDVESGSERRHSGNLAGTRRDVAVPEFGARELVKEIDSAEKIARELDRQLRSSSKVHRTDAVGSGSVNRDSSIMSQAAVGEEIMELTDGMGERRSLRAGASFFNVSNDSTPLTHTHTRMVNVAVIDRQSPQEKNKGSPGGDEETTQFRVQEATILPQRTGMSLLMFDLCCAKPRIRRDQKKQHYSGALPASTPSSNRCVESSTSMLEKMRRSKGSDWDPSTDAHFTTARGQAQLARDRPRYRVEPTGLHRLLTLAWAQGGRAVQLADRRMDLTSKAY